MNQEDFRALVTLFEQHFTQTALRHCLADVPDGQRILLNLYENTNMATVAHDAADIIKRYGTYKTAEFWDVLENAIGKVEAPKVRALRIRVGAPASIPLAPPTTAPQATPAAQQAAPSQLIVLLFAASPDDKVRLRVDAEFRDIIDKVDHGRYHGRIRFEQVHAARLSDLRTALNNHRPHVLHISSHGEKDGSLQLENRHTTGAQAISKQRLLDLIEALNERLQLIVLNACDSHVIARDIPPMIDLAIGMKNPVSDQAAIDFSVAFYETLASGKSVERALKAARASLDDEEYSTPELFPSADNDPKEKRKLVLVKTS